MTHTKYNYTIGIDPGDKTHETCTINSQGEIIERSSVLNSKEDLLRFSSANPGATLIMEASCHFSSIAHRSGHLISSPGFRRTMLKKTRPSTRCRAPSSWINRLFTQQGHKVIVANPRKLRAIYESDNRNDQRDAGMLAHIGRFDRKLLYGIDHRSEAHQRALKIIDGRDVLVSARVKLINSVRGSLRSLGVFLPSGWSSDAFARKATEFPAEEDYALVAPLLETIAKVSERIKAQDERIDALIGNDYPIAQKLMTIPGVGPVTALAFVLIIGSPERFAKTREVGPCPGLVPGRDQSGDTDKPMRITKAGNRMLRRLRVNCTQYMLGKFGPDSALKESGKLKMAAGAKVARKKAVISTARKLAVLMPALWKNPVSEYQAYPNKPKKKLAA